MKIKTFSYTLLFSACFASTAFSGDMGAVKTDYWPVVASISAGPVWQDDGETHSLYVMPTIVKTYTTNNHNETIAAGEFFIGTQYAYTESWPIQFGLAFATTSNAKISGNVWDDADPAFNNFVYDYQIKHSHVAIKGKLLADRGYPVLPWVSGSIGVGFNYARQFHSWPTIFEALPTPNFASHTETAFTYTVGAGIQKAITTNWQVGVGYEFSDWGQSHLDRAPTQAINHGPYQNHVYTNGLLFNITYLS